MKPTLVLAALALAGCPESPPTGACASTADCAVDEVCVADTCIPAGGLGEGEGEGEGEGDGPIDLTPRLSLQRLTSGSVSSSSSSLRAVQHLGVVGGASMRSRAVVVTTH
jgi:hypothetical protein